MSMGSTSNSGRLEKAIASQVIRVSVPAILKNRKRQYAPRSRTGCFTCRRRKKKCDEAKPGCNNCERGGFVCTGYADKLLWCGKGITKLPLSIQAKERTTAELAPVDSRRLICTSRHTPLCKTSHVTTAQNGQKDAREQLITISLAPSRCGDNGRHGQVRLPPTGGLASSWTYYTACPP